MNIKSKRIKSAWHVFPKRLKKKLCHIAAVSSGYKIKIEMIHQQNHINIQMTEFWFKPEADIKLYQVQIKNPSFNDQIRSDNKRIFEKEVWHQFVGYENIQTGLKWQFAFYGSDIKKHQFFKRTVRYTVW